MRSTSLSTQSKGFSLRPRQTEPISRNDSAHSLSSHRLSSKSPPTQDWKKCALCDFPCSTVDDVRRNLRVANTPSFTALFSTYHTMVFEATFGFFRLFFRIIHWHASLALTHNNHNLTATVAGFYLASAANHQQPPFYSAQSQLSSAASHLAIAFLDLGLPDHTPRSPSLPPSGGTPASAPFVRGLMPPPPVAVSPAPYHPGLPLYVHGNRSTQPPHVTTT